MKETEAPRAQISATMKLHTVSSSGSHGVECFTLAWTAGLLAAFLHERAAAALLLLFGIAAAFGRKPRERLMIVLGAVLGVLCWVRYDIAVRQPLCALDGKTLTCTGRIIEMQPLQSDRVIYTLRTELDSRRVSVDWYADASVPRLQIGDTVTLEAALTRIPPDYRYHTAAYQAGYGKYLRIYDAKLLTMQPEAGFSLRRSVFAYRQQITAQIETAMSQEDAALLCAMMFGDDAALSDETAEDLNHAGIGHIAAVSGLHLVFFCGVMSCVLRRLRFSAKAVCLVHIPAILLFILLVDASVSVYRAAVMVMLSQSAALFGRRGDTLRSLSIAMFLCTVLTPYVIGSAAFWLSVSGVFGMGVLAPYMTKRLRCRSAVKGFLGLCCVAVSVFPASVLLWGESSLLSPVGNLLILPLCIAALYIGFFLLLTGGRTGFLLPLAEVLCRFVRVITRGIAALPFSHVTLTSPVMRTAVILLTGLLLFALLRGIPPKKLTAAAMRAAVLLAALSAGWYIKSASQLRIAVLGGSRQAALVISARGSTVIADLSDAPRNAQYVRRYLRDAGISRAEVLVLGSGKPASAYQAQLPMTAVGSVVMRGAPWREDAEVCGQPVMFADDTAVVVQCGGAAVLIEEQTAQITWQDMKVAAVRADSDTDADAVIRYGEAAECEITFPAGGQSARGNNLLLILTADGKGGIEWLMP